MALSSRSQQPFIFPPIGASEPLNRVIREFGDGGDRGCGVALNAAHGAEELSPVPSSYDRPVVIRVRVRKWRCQSPTCRRSKARGRHRTRHTWLAIVGFGVRCGRGS
jgi:hypothetical protein